MDTNDKPLTIQQVADATGLSEHTLRYYERIGLIHPINRASSGHRRYSSADIGWIDFLTKLRATGMSIQQMQQYAELQRQGDTSLSERVQMLEAHRTQVQARVDELCQHLNLISYKIDLYSEQVAQAQTEQPEPV